MTTLTAQTNAGLIKCTSVLKGPRPGHAIMCLKASLDNSERPLQRAGRQLVSYPIAKAVPEVSEPWCMGESDPSTQIPG